MDTDHKPTDNLTSSDENLSNIASSDEFAANDRPELSASQNVTSDSSEYNFNDLTGQPNKSAVFHQAQTVELDHDYPFIPILSALSPGSFLSIRNKYHYSVSINLVLSLLFLLIPLYCAKADIFPAYLLATSLFLLVACWLFGIIYSFTNYRLLRSSHAPWVHAGLAFLSFWLPFALCFFLSSTVTFDRLWLGSDMMEPSLQAGDNILINRLSYKSQDPTYGDIVLVESHNLAGENGNPKVIIGRIIARPGDRVQLSGFRPSVNGKILPQYQKKQSEDLFDQPILTYEIPYGVEVPASPEDEPSRWYPVMTTSQLLFTQTNEVTLDPDFYYMLEDNRDTKNERTRAVYGYILRRDEIKGKPQFILHNSQNENAYERFGMSIR